MGDYMDNSFSLAVLAVADGLVTLYNYTTWHVRKLWEVMTSKTKRS